MLNNDFKSIFSTSVDIILNILVILRHIYVYNRLPQNVGKLFLFLTKVKKETHCILFFLWSVFRQIWRNCTHGETAPLYPINIIYIFLNSFLRPFQICKLKYLYKWLND